ncbi:hypothetical protein AVEN_86914-1 [Araneus ventricosus]|uniref:Uncharacterized protein n=1 Tax=Araneus ventricosus TaxID=182803 RepID=A0A4Y2RRG6_ARAVE|nr:hypothetical protein AVEN_86914-1 [Araneus ventricosus]
MSPTQPGGTRIDPLVASVSDNFQSSDVNKFENHLAAIERTLSRLEVPADHSCKKTLRFEVLINANIVGGILSLEIGQKMRTATPLNRKLVQPALALAVKKGWLSACLFMKIYYRIFNTRNSAVSVLPILGSKIVPSKFVLYAANGTKINTFGTKLITLNLGLKRKFQWPFILASVSKPILGADFLEHYSLLVDMKPKKLLDQCCWS